LTQRLAFVTRLYSEEVHLLVGRSVGSIEDLRGKQIARRPTMARRSLPRRICGRLQLGAELVTAARPMRSTRFVRAVWPQLCWWAASPCRSCFDCGDGSVRLLDLSFARSG
jgi:hypothetical protein